MTSGVLHDSQPIAHKLRFISRAFAIVVLLAAREGGIAGAPSFLQYTPPNNILEKTGGGEGLHLDICQYFLGIVHSRTRCVQTYRYCFRCKEIGTAPRNGQCMPA